MANPLGRAASAALRAARGLFLPFAFLFSIAIAVGFFFSVAGLFLYFGASVWILAFPAVLFLVSLP